MKKLAVKTPTKKTSKKSLSAHHLKPIDELLGSMQNCEHKLKNLLESIPAKLEKLITAVKSKLAKTIEQHKKAGLALKTIQTQHKTKPSKLTQTAIKKSEQAQAGIAAAVVSMKEELTTLQTQLATCKDMKKVLNTSSKFPVKKAAAKKPMPKRAKKVVLDPPDIIAAEHF